MHFIILHAAGPVGHLHPNDFTILALLACVGALALYVQARGRCP